MHAIFPILPKRSAINSDTFFMGKIRIAAEYLFEKLKGNHFFHLIKMQVNLLFPNVLL